MPSALEEFLPILALLVVVGIVIARLPRVDLGHSDAFRFRRVTNWLPVGLLYAFLYMGRYNLTVAKGALGEAFSIQEFSLVFGIGTATYGCAFLLNGPLTDRIGGKKAILIGATGAALANFAMGLVIWQQGFQQPALEPQAASNLVPLLALLYAANMYFQSFGAVAIVKINAPWFHVRERGVFGAIFGILISLGIYFAFDVGGMIVSNFGVAEVFFVPAALLATFVAIVAVRVQDSPAKAGFEDFDTADASSGDDGPQLGAIEVFRLMFRQPVIVTIACIEFCSGFLRQAIMNYYRAFSKAVDPDGTSFQESWVYDNWGVVLCCAGILGGTFAGVLSDKLFHSRRGPVAALLYGLMLVSAIALTVLYVNPWMGWVIAFMSMSVIGVHGMLSGTASMDFGGKKNVGVAVGIIDGFVYAGTAVMALTYWAILPDELDANYRDLEAWRVWPVSMVPIALLGLVLASRVWNAKPKGRAPAPPVLGNLVPDRAARAPKRLVEKA
ncbi:MAG: MFS transporter [Planctomycetota bacterium]